MIDLSNVQFDPDDEDLKIHYPYPEVGDTLLKSTGNKLFFTHSISGIWSLYAEGYKQAADRLVDQISSQPIEDVLVCPVLYLYRHFIELTLKYTARRLSHISPIAIPTISPKKKKTILTDHKLLPLWNYIKDNLTYTNAQFNQDIVDVVGSLIKEMDDIDPGSMLFRYSRDKQDNKTSLPDHIDAANLKSVIEKLNIYFNEIVIAVDLKQEWLEEMASWG